LGSLRHSLSNTDARRSTDRSTITERQQSRDLAINTEPKIMYSKDVGDYDVRKSDTNVDDNQQREYFEEHEFTWNALHGRRAPLHSQSATYEQSLQTDLYDTQRELGYIVRPLKTKDDTIEEERQEIITYRVPIERSLDATTEETYETIVTTENRRPYEENVTQTKHENIDTIIRKSELTEWSRLIGNRNVHASINTQQDGKHRSQSPEELVEESYEVVSTLTKPNDGTYLITSTKPTPNVSSSSTQRIIDPSASKPVSSEDDSSYCEEWTVTEAKRKQDGQTVKTIIDR
jgi:hypothetical protein